MRIVFAAGVICMAGCASVESVESAGLSADVARDAPLERLPPPVSSADAQAYLSGSLAAMRAGKPQHATMFLEAILRSDHLTERGRANVYWLAAEAHRLTGEEKGLVDALGGFLVAAEVLPPDDDMRRREVEARAALLARKLKQHPLLGKSAADAIPVEDARDAPGVVAELGCVEDAVSTVPAQGERRVEQRRVICTDTGETVVLFFDVTQTR